MAGIQLYFAIGVIWSFLVIGMALYFYGFIQPCLQGFKDQKCEDE